MLPPRDDKFLLITLGAAAMAVVFAWQAGIQTGYRTGFTAAKHLVENSRFGELFRTPDDIRTLAGTVTSVGRNSFTLRTTPTDPFAEPVERTVFVTASTTLNSLSFPDPTSTRTAPTTRNASIPKDTEPPVYFNLTPLTLADIKTGDSVIVFTSENARSALTVTADMVQVQSTIAPPAHP